MDLIRVSHLYFFLILNKEQNSSFLQLRKRLFGKMLVLGFVYSKKYIHSPAKKCKKKKMSNDCVFRLILTNTCTLKIIHSKLPVHGHDPKFFSRYKTVPLVYNKSTSKWSSNAQI